MRLRMSRKPSTWDFMSSASRRPRSSCSSRIVCRSREMEMLISTEFVSAMMASATNTYFCVTALFCYCHWPVFYIFCCKTERRVCAKAPAAMSQPRVQHIPERQIVPAGTERRACAFPGDTPVRLARSLFSLAASRPWGEGGSHGFCRRIVERAVDIGKTALFTA